MVMRTYKAMRIASSFHVRERSRVTKQFGCGHMVTGENPWSQFCDSGCSWIAYGGDYPLCMPNPT